MPIATQPSTKATLTFRHNPEKPIPQELRADYSQRTQARQAFADWLASRYLYQELANPRRAVLKYMRETGAIPPDGRLNRAATAQLNYQYGPHCATLLHKDQALALDALLAQIRAYREPDDPHPGLHDPSPAPVARPYQPPSPEQPGALDDGTLGPAIWAQLQASNREEFATYLERRRGRCRPYAVFRQWRKPARYKHVRSLVELELGTRATRLFDDLSPLTTREELASKLKDL